MLWKCRWEMMWIDRTKASGRGYENSEVGSFAINWYYRGGGPEQLVAVLKKNPQLPVTAVLRTLLKRQCTK
jgi:hypothetical protein